MYILLVIIILIVAAFLAWEPRIDRNKTGEILLWYNSGDKHHHRKYINLSKI